MQKEVIETSKGKFVVKDLIFIPLDCNGIKLSEIPEEEASEIVDEPFGLGVGDNNILVFKDYEDEDNAYLSSIDSLHSLLKSKGIKITNNTYIFKL